MKFNSLTKNNSPKRQNRAQNAGNINNLLSTGLLVCTSLSLTAILAGFVLLCASEAKDIQPQVRLDQIPAAVTIHWGVLALICTPIMQVIIALVKFSLDRDKVFAGIALSILAFLGVCFASALL